MADVLNENERKATGRAIRRAYHLALLDGDGDEARALANAADHLGIGGVIPRGVLRFVSPPVRRDPHCLHTSGHPENDPACCLCEGSPCGAGPHPKAEEHAEWQARDEEHRKSLQPSDSGDPWTPNHIDDNDLDGRGIRSAFGV